MNYRTVTAFCRSSNGGGTTHISAVEVDREPESTFLERARAEAIVICAEDWMEDPLDGTIQCVGLADGDVQILEWDDEPEG